MNVRLRRLITLSFLVVIEMILTRGFSLTLPFMRISFGAVAIMIAGYFFGTKMSVAVAVVSDLIGATLFPSGPFFPGFTLSAALTGLFYGQLYQHKLSWQRLLLIVVFHNIALTLVNTVWLVMIMGAAKMADLPLRLVKTVIMMPLETFVGFHVIRLLEKQKIF